MADHRKPAGPDDTPAIFDQMDALMARHRGSGPDQSIPVLREIAVPPGQRNARGAPDAIPVLTEVESMIGDDFMFTPEEIHPPEQEPAYEPPPVSRAPEAPAPIRQTPTLVAVPKPPVVMPADQAPIPMMDAPLLPDAPRRAAPPVQSAPPPPSAGSGFDFPLLDLDEPETKAPAAAPPRPVAIVPTPPPRPPVAAPAAAPAAQDEQFMPELTLNFDFSLPADDRAKATAAPVHTSMVNSAARADAAEQAEAASRLAASSGYMSAPTVGLSIELQPDEEPAPEPPPAMMSMESQTVGLRIEVPHAQSGNAPGTERRASPRPGDAAPPPAASALTEPAAPPPPAVDPAALANELMVLLKPHLEKMVRVEMSRQIASIHSAAIKNVLGVLQPKLGPLVAQAVRQVLSKRS